MPVATRRVLIGNAEIVNAEQARIAAKKVLARVALGEDPSAQRADRRGKDRLTHASAVVAEFLAAKEPELAPRSLVEVRRYSDRHALLRTVARHAARRHHPQGHRQPHGGDRARARDSTATRARGAVSGFFTWAMRMGLSELNPTIGAVAPPPSKPRERVLSDEELAAIWKACSDDDYGRSSSC